MKHGGRISAPAASVSREHRAHVLATVEDALIDSGEIRSRLTRVPDDVTVEPRRASLPGL